MCVCVIHIYVYMNISRYVYIYVCNYLFCYAHTFKQQRAHSVHIPSLERIFGFLFFLEIETAISAGDASKTRQNFSSD